MLIKINITITSVKWMSVSLMIFRSNVFRPNVLSAKSPFRKMPVSRMPFLANVSRSNVCLQIVCSPKVQPRSTCLKYIDFLLLPTTSLGGWVNQYLYLYIGEWKCVCRNGYRCGKWTRWPVFKPWTRLLTFHIGPITFRNVCNLLFSFYL